ncbi:MAG TPA: chitobiase/beta-hexosaminidase C-terminal domain-containing protein, partial [Silvibacterium sp.]|nr:chitobiase/beta-hexosaminidase C-terminal domain-containing protein [Silvibacterium sp.]
YTNSAVTITDATPGATIYYTINRGTPTTSSTVYRKPIALNSPGTFTIQAIAVASGYGLSAVASATYTITPGLARPVFTPAAGSYTTPQTVTISDISTKTIYYTTDGSMPTTSSPQYAGPITVSANESIKAIAVLSGFTNSPVASAGYIIEPQLPTPTIGPAPGTYTSTMVTITDATPDVTIYYALDGIMPTTAFPVYKGPVLLNHPGSYDVRAIAVANGYINSAVASAVYTIRPVLARPVFTPAAGSYTTPQTVTISDISTKTIYYTTDGSMPTTSSPQYNGPITVSANETIKAIAVLSGYVNSPVNSASYTIGP